MANNGPAPLACGNTLPQSQIVDKSGLPTRPMVKWMQDIQQRLSAGLTELGQLIGEINAGTEISGRGGTIGTALQNLDQTGVLDAVALSGTIQPPRLPAPSIGALGGVQAVDPLANSWVHAIDTSGAPQLSQPAFANLSGAATAAQVPALSNLVGAVTAAQVPNLSALNGAVTAAQVPALSLLSGKVTAAQLPSDVPVVSFGSGAPAGASTEGYLYFDTSVAPFQGYVYQAAAWNKFS